MKKIIAILLTAFMVFSLAACGGSGSNTSNTKTTEKEAVATTEQKNNRLDELRDKKDEQNKEIEEKEEAEKKAKEEQESKEKAQRDGITTNSKLLEDLTDGAWGYLNSGKSKILWYMSFDDNGTVYFAGFYDYSGGNLLGTGPSEDKVYGNVVVGLNHGEYAIDEDKAEIIMFYPKFNTSKMEPYEDGKIIESHALYSYENGKLVIKGDTGTGCFSFEGDYLVDYINDDAFVDFYNTVVINGNKKKESVKDFYQNHPDFIREEQDR